MISWEHPFYLTALVLGPALAFFFVWAARRRRQALAAFIASALWPAVAPDLDPRRRVLRAALLVFAVLTLALAIAGPLWGFRWEEVKREGIDLVIALDTSRSMLATDVKPNRLVRAKLAIQDLTSTLRGDRVGLVAFAGTAFVQCPLTLDYGAFAQSLEAIDVGIIPKGGTALAAAIDAGLEAFEGRQGKNQALILITDGEDHEGAVKEATERATTRGVKIYTVGIGTSEGELIPREQGGYLKDRGGQVVKSRLGEETLKQIAIDTGGVYLHAAGAAFGLAELYRDYIGAMEKRELASTLERRFEARFQFPLALTLLLLVAEAMIGERRPAPRASAGDRALPEGRGVGGASARARAVAALAVALTSIAWLDPHAATREANRLFEQGNYDAAAEKYNQALVDEPDSALLHFNLGAAAYKRKQYQDALGAYEKAPAPEDAPARSAAVAYNIGNTRYRLGETLEGSDPKAALEHYAGALVAYRRALGVAPDDADAKFNYEFVKKKMDELRKKLEEQQQRQPQDQQQEDDQQQAEQKQQEGEQQEEGQPKPEDQPGEQQQEAGQKPEQQKDEQPSPGEQAGGEENPQRAAEQPPQPESQAGGGDSQEQPAGGETAGAEGGGDEAGDLSRREAAALLDAQRDQEVQPDEVIRKLQGARVAEPAEDW